MKQYKPAGVSRVDDGCLLCTRIRFARCYVEELQISKVQIQATRLNSFYFVSGALQMQQGMSLTA